MRFASVLVIAALGLGFTTISAFAAEPGRVVLYTSIDEPYVTPLVKRFHEKTGIEVQLVTDGEATKTAGLVEKIQAEKANPKADVYWGNEIFHTINLAHAGVFAPYRSPAAQDIPDRWRDKDGLYTDIGMRARFIALSTRPQFKAAVANIKSMEDLTNPALKGKIAVCHPGFGTASGQFAALYIVLGDEKYRRLMQGLRANDIKLLGGNSVVAEQVCAGTIAAGPTDNDDVNNAIAEGEKMAGVVPNQDTYGTLLIPTTIALVNQGPNSANGQKLIDFLLDPAVERELIAGRYLAYSTRTASQQVKAMDVDYAQVAREMRKAVEIALTILQDRR